MIIKRVAYKTLVSIRSTLACIVFLVMMLVFLVPSRVATTDEHMVVPLKVMEQDGTP